MWITIKTMDSVQKAAAPKQSQSQQAKHWIVVINNPTESDYAIFVANRPLFEYYVIGKEKGEAKETPHIQGYVALKKKLRMKALSKIFPRAYLEVKRGTPKQAADYCKKDGDFEEWGELPAAQTEKATAASAERYTEARKSAEEGRLDDIDDELFIKHYTNLKKIAQDTRNRIVPSDLTWKSGHPPNDWYYGPTGTGKSFTARSNNPGFYLKMNNKWWENYEGEACVLIEDIGRTHEWMGDYLKIWADRYFILSIYFGMRFRPHLHCPKLADTSQYSTLPWAAPAVPATAGRGPLTLQTGNGKVHRGKVRPTFTSGFKGV